MKEGTNIYAFHVTVKLYASTFMKYATLPFKIQ